MESLPSLENLDRIAAAKVGIDLCKVGKWRRALDYLTVASSHGYSQELPPAYFSYFGLATAVVTRRYRTATRLCELAVRRNPCVAANYVNLVHLRMLMGQSGKAWEALRKGLAFVPDDPELLAIHKEEFCRQDVVLPFLRRSHPINIMLGKMRARLREDFENLAA